MAVTSVEDRIGPQVQAVLEGRADESDHVEWATTITAMDFEYDPEDEDDHCCEGRLEGALSLYVRLVRAGDEVALSATFVEPLAMLERDSEVTSWVNSVWDTLVFARMATDVSRIEGS